MPKPFECASGSYTGTGAAQTITLGFEPKFFITYNSTDGDCVAMHFDGMTDDTAISITTLVAAVAANGVTFSATGLSLGTDSSVNENAKAFKYVAVGGN